MDPALHTSVFYSKLLYTRESTFYFILQSNILNLHLVLYTCVYDLVLFTVVLVIYYISCYFYVHIYLGMHFFHSTLHISQLI